MCVLVAVNQSDEEEEWAERDGTSQHSFHQQHCPAAQQEDVDKQPADTTERRVSPMIKAKTKAVKTFHLPSKEVIHV